MSSPQVLEGEQAYVKKKFNTRGSSRTHLTRRRSYRLFETIYKTSYARKVSQELRGQTVGCHEGGEDRQRAPLLRQARP